MLKKHFALNKQLIFSWTQFEHQIFGSQFEAFRFELKCGILWLSQVFRYIWVISMINVLLCNLNQTGFFASHTRQYTHLFELPRLHGICCFFSQPCQTFHVWQALEKPIINWSDVSFCVIGIYKFWGRRAELICEVCKLIAGHLFNCIFIGSAPGFATNPRVFSFFKFRFDSQVAMIEPICWV